MVSDLRLRAKVDLVKVSVLMLSVYPCRICTFILKIPAAKDNLKRASTGSLSGAGVRRPPVTFEFTGISCPAGGRRSLMGQEEKPWD
jgi:hypothetical protein